MVPTQRVIHMRLVNE